MKEDKLHWIRKTLTVVCLILLFATAGLFLIKTQIKTITLDYFGNKKSIYTLGGTVSDVLLQNKIILGNDDIITPDKNSFIDNGSEIKITTNRQISTIDIEEKLKSYNVMVAKIEQVEEAVPFSEEKKDSALIDRGSEKTVQEGKEGKKATEYLVRYTNGSEIARIEVGTQMLSEPQNKVIEVGTKLPTMSSRSRSAVSATTDSGFKQYNISMPVEQQQFAYNISQKYGIQYELFLAVMYKESGFRASAVGGGNSYGLCQIHISNHSMLSSKLGVSNFFDPYDNMTAGAYLLSMYFGSARNVVSGDAVEAYALNSYNMGEGVYFSKCYSQGILDRAYSNTVKSIRNRLLTTGTI